MRTGLVAVAVVAAAAAPIASTATGKDKKPSPRAKNYYAKIAPVGADAAYAGIRGKAKLVDTKKSDSITINMKGLKPGTTYPWHIHVAAAANPCAAGATQGPIVSAFKYRTLKARKSGNANATGKAKRGKFTVDPTKGYYVNVHDPLSGAPIACGVLKKKPKPKSSSGKGGSGKSGGKRPR